MMTKRCLSTNLNRFTKSQKTKQSADLNMTKKLSQLLQRIDYEKFPKEQRLHHLQLCVFRSRAFIASRLHTQKDPQFCPFLPERSHVQDTGHLHEEHAGSVEVGRRVEAVLKNIKT